MTHETTFTRDGIRFHGQSAGTGRPFVFQHGLGGDVSQPFGLFQPPAGTRLLSFDVRGHGQTAPVGDPDGLSFHTFGDDLAAFLDHMQAPQAIIGGISMGAALALHFATRWPERVTGLVLSRPAWLEAPCPFNVRVFSLISSLLQRCGPTHGLEEFQQSEIYLETRAQWPDVADSLAQQFLKPGVEESAVKLERIIRDTPHPDRQAWSRIRVPTLILGNQLDPIHPFEYAEELSHVIPGAEFAEITPKSVSVERHGADVQRALDGFLRRRFPSPS